MVPNLRIHLLGDFLLLSDDTPVTTLNVPRLQSLLAYLVLHQAAPQDRSRLAFLLWPDSSEAQAHTNLRKLLYQLRQALPNADLVLHIDKHTLRWQPAPQVCWTLDIQEFERALAQAAQARQASDSSVLRQALTYAVSLYRGDLLPGCYDEWLLPERERVRQAFLQATERLIALFEQEHDYDAAIETAQRLLRHDPLHEGTYRQLMRFYALRGERAAALRVYHTCVTVLERELAAEPSEATRQAYEELLQKDVPVQPKHVSVPVRGGGAPLVGRRQEWGHLLAAWRKAAAGSPHMVVLAGEAGIGKTRLAEELLSWARRQGVATASAHCYATQGRLAYAPVAAWLREEAVQAGLASLGNVWLSEVARLAPDLLARSADLPRPAPMVEGWQRQYFFEALAHALLDSRQSLLLLLDDLQWCDNETLDWLQYLLHFAPDARLLLVSTVRSEEVLPDHPLVAFLAALQRSALLTEIALKPLGTVETVALAEHVLGHQLTPALTDALYHETEGNPLFVVEMVRAGALAQIGNGAKQPQAAPSPLAHAPSTLPTTVQTVLSARFAPLSPSAREVANVAAVIGREFSFPVLARASAESEDAVVRGLDELWQRRIIREQGEGSAETYDFSHDKLREHVYRSLSSASRRRLHRRVAQAIEELYANDLDAVSGQIATHYEQASLVEQALPYYQRAGEVALRIYAGAVALATYQRAVALIEAGVPGYGLQEKHWQVATGIYMGLGDVFAAIGRLEESRQAHQRAMACAPAHEYIWQSRLLRKIANTWRFLSDSPHDDFRVRANEAYQEAGRLLERAPDQSSIEWRQEWIQLQLEQLLPLRVSVEEMNTIIEKAQPVIERYGTPEQRNHFSLALTARDAVRDRHVISAETVAYCRRALNEAEVVGVRGMLGFANFALGVCLLWSGQLDEAEERLSTALRIGEQTGNAIVLARSLTFLPFVYRFLGQVEQVRAALSRALPVAEATNTSIIAGQQAWVAWRDGKRDDARACALAALEHRQGLRRDHQFYWTALWPLIGLLLTKDDEHRQVSRQDLAEAIEYVRILLDPSQQPPPEQLRALLSEALRAWEAEETAQARSLLQQALPLAREKGYL